MIDNLVVAIYAYNDRSLIIWTIPTNKKTLPFISKSDSDNARADIKTTLNENKPTNRGLFTNELGRHAVSLSEPNFTVVIVRGAVGIFCL